MAVGVDVGSGGASAAPRADHGLERPGRQRYAPWAVGATTTALCLVWAGIPAWSGDEAATVVVVARSGEELRAVLANDPALAPYYLLMDGWSTVSTAALWLRLPSALAMGTAAGTLFALVAWVLGHRPAWLSAAAFALMPAVSRYGQEARPYALALAAVVVFVLLWWCYLVGGRARTGWGALAALTAAGLLHAYSLLIGVAVLVAVALVPVVERRRDVLRTGAIAAGAALLLSPYLLLLAGRAKGHPDPGAVSLPGIAEELARLPVSRLSMPLAPALSLIVVLLAAAGIVLALLRLRGAPRAFVAAVLMWAAVPPLAMAALQAVTDRPGVVARYWLICLPAVAIGVALALDRLRGRALPAAAVAVLAALAVPSLAELRTADGHLGERWSVLPRALAVPGIDDVGLLIRGYPERGLAANDPVAADVRTPLNGDAAAEGTLSPAQARPGTPAFDALLRDEELVLVYRTLDGAPLRPVDRLGQPEALTDMFSEPVVVCRWFQDQLVLLGKPDARPATGAAAVADALEALAPEQVSCRAA